jgi:hypothetical protein
VLTVVILLSLRLVLGRPREALLLPISLIAGSAAGGTWLMRREGAGWPEPVYAGLLSAALVMVVLRLAFPGLGPLSPGRYPGAVRDLVKSLLAYFVVGGSGAFVLPMFDPVVRRSGPRPAVWKIVLAALLVVALLVATELVLTAKWGGFRYSFFGVGVLVVGSVAAAVVAGLGLLFTVVGARDIGAWAGGLGLCVEAITLVVWILLGMRWFP